MGTRCTRAEFADGYTAYTASCILSRACPREESAGVCVCVCVVQLVWQCTQHTCLSHMYMQCDEVRAGIINRDSV